jgi:hypothetical protein
MSEKEDEHEHDKSCSVLSLNQGYKCIFITNGILNWDYVLCQKKLSLSTSHEISLLFMTLEGSPPCPQEPATKPYPEPDESNLYPPNTFYHFSFNNILFSSGLPTKIMYEDYCLLVTPCSFLDTFRRFEERSISKYITDPKPPVNIYQTTRLQFSEDSNHYDCEEVKFYIKCMCF